MAENGPFSRQCGTWSTPRSWLLAALLALAASLTPARATAAAGPWARADLVEARLVAAVEGVGDLRAVPLGVELRIPPGWKTYWRSPGDAGLPPTLDWSGSANLAGASLSFPAAQRFQLFGLQTFGYGDHVLFPVAAAVAEPGWPLELAARLDVLVCADVCVPQAVDLALGLPAGPAAPAPEAQLIARFAARVPGDGTALGLAIEGARPVALGDGRVGLEVTASASEPLTAPDVFAELDPHLAFGPPDVRLLDGGRRAVLTLPLAGKLPAGAGLAGRPVTFTLVDGPRAAERATLIAEGGPAGGAWDGAAPLAGMVGLALLGGLILNLMPCVLPVLSLKLLSVVGHGGGAPARVRAGFLATAAGIVSSFLAIAAGLVALQAAGRTVGWGIQFQEPLFIAAMLLLVTLFACNLWGFFEVVLPGPVADRAARGGSRGGLAGEFATGALATLLATPCSAPFLGTAVGFALAAGSWWQVLLIFLALGLGLALPYLAVALVPRLATALPRPGRWMLRLRQALGFALAATGVWLLAVLAGQVGAGAASLVGGLILALVAALGVRHAAAPSTWRGGASAATAGALALVVLAVSAVADGRAGRAATAAIVGETVDWAPFDRDRARGLVAQGRTVFVDVTADWCITCKTNKRLVLDTEPVAARLAAETVAMRADWTSPDPAVSAFLAAYGRYGIPFNVVYGPGEPAGVVLPEVLTERAVLDALDRAGRRASAQASPDAASAPAQARTFR